MKKFSMPEIEVCEYAVEDVITASGITGGGTGGNYGSAGGGEE